MSDFISGFVWCCFLKLQLWLVFKSLPIRSDWLRGPKLERHLVGINLRKKTYFNHSLNFSSLIFRFSSSFLFSASFCFLILAAVRFLSDSFASKRWISNLMQHKIMLHNKLCIPYAKWRRSNGAAKMHLFLQAKVYIFLQLFDVFQFLYFLYLVRISFS